jgi:glycine cleavage system H lipoate-binding protein
MDMKCPFLEEIVVRYCKAYPVKKLIPSTNSDVLSLCLSEDHCKCSEYKEVAETKKEDFMGVRKVSGDPKMFPPGFWRICNIFACSACPYESICVGASRIERKVSFIEGFGLLENLHYHPKHAWVDLRKDGTIRVGLDDFAQKLLGDVTRLSLPEKGKEVNEEDFTWIIKCGNRSVKLRSPIAGKVKRTNRKLGEDPSTLKKDPYGSWLFALKPYDLETSLRKLLIGDDAKRWLEMEADRLRYRIESDVGVTVADGGALMHTIEKIDKEDWENLVKAFLLA